ncbi:Efflux pump mlcE [Hyphodiscus hymeniophilus]|uniref:Efflux pump mlcE n=1 Tax=Hyphodiscus hymeniophilus TaxID=353542 RepID=A0A9P6SQ27_9HELO|nr:Efflux pump mlcE [Hyphodiscus hymeniophilus]
MNSSTTIAESQQVSPEEKDPNPDSSIDSNNGYNTENENGVPAEAQKSLTGYQLYLVVFAISLAGFLYSLDVTIIVTVSQNHEIEIRYPCRYYAFSYIKDIGWYGSAYLITL